MVGTQDNEPIFFQWINPRASSMEMDSIAFLTLWTLKRFMLPLTMDCSIAATMEAEP